jgi:hypothetical protein
MQQWRSSSHSSVSAANSPGLTPSTLDSANATIPDHPRMAFESSALLTSSRGVGSWKRPRRWSCGQNPRAKEGTKEIELGANVVAVASPSFNAGEQVTRVGSFCESPLRGHHEIVAWGGEIGDCTVGCDLQ